MVINQKTKAILSILTLSFLLILLQTSICFARNDSSGSKSSSESTRDATEEDYDFEEADAETTDTDSTEESAEIAVPESMAMSLTSVGPTGSSSGGTLSVPEAATVSQVGAATFSYPIAVPPGRNGLQPNIALSYSSYNGNGWLGVGWDLNLGSIKRSTKNGLDYSAYDFVAGGSELVANGNYYCAKIEGAFTRYEYVSESSGWIAHAKDGTKYYYGQSSASQMTNSYGTYSWHLDKVEDTNGNYMTITYTKNGGQIYPDYIAYTGNTGDSGLTLNKTVEFELDDRNDDTQSYKTHSLVTTSKRLKTITVKVGTDTVYEYDLAYEYSSGNGRSRLVDITRVDPDPTTPENTPPPTEFTWIDGGDGTFGPVNTLTLNGAIGDTSVLVFGDINGDGREDFIKVRKYITTPILYPYLANGLGGFTAQPTKSLAQCGSDYISVALGDIDGDGDADIVSNGTNGKVHAYLSYGNGTFSSAHTTTWSWFGADTILLADLNGDGKADLLKYRKAPEPPVPGMVPDHNFIYAGLSNCDGWFGDPVSTTLPTISNFDPYLHMNDRTISMGDVNGDGILDLYSHSNILFNPYQFPPGTSANVNGVLIGNGLGGFESTYFYQELNPAGLGIGKVADVNGDGLADLVFSGNGAMAVLLSTGTGMASPSYMPGLPNFAMSDLNDDGITDMIVESSGNNYFLPFGGSGMPTSWGIPADGPIGTEAIILADINGDGRADMIKYNGTSISYSMADGDIAGAGDHIELITNPLGGETSILYGNNTDIENNIVPFELHPVMDIQSDDGYNVSLTTYAYSGAYYDYEERDFRGFSTVTQTNPDGTTVETTYEQYNNYIKGVPLTIEMTAQGESYPFSKTTYTWGTYPVPPTTWAFVKLIQKKAEINDNHDSTFDEYTQENYTYDDTHGGVLTTVSSGSGDAENITVSNTYINIGTWVWRKAGESITGSSSGLVRQISYTYFSTNGNLATKTHVNTSGSNPVEEYTYDSYGNLHTYEDPKNETTTYTYDSASYTNIETITYPATGGVTHSVGMTYYDYGKIYTESDENNKTTYYYYDDFKRLQRVEYPDGGETEYTYENYIDETLPAYIKTSVLEYTGSYVDAYQYVDGFGRAIMNVSKGESGGSNDYVVTRQHYDEMGRGWQTEGPYFTGTYAFSHTPLGIYPTVEKTFDFAGRVKSVKTPQYLGNTLTSYDTTIIDYDGFETIITDADGNIRIETTDAFGRIIMVDEDPADGGTTFYDYNAAGDLVGIEDDAGNVTSISYNTLGQKTSMTDPDMGTWGYLYDLNGNLYQQTDAKGQIIRFTYDALNRITLKDYYNTSDPDVYYYYDNLSIANGRGRLNYVTNGNVTTTYNSYDEMGREESVTKNITGDTNRTTLFTYDLSGKPVRTTYPDGFWAQNNYYNGTNLLNSVTASDGVTYAAIGSYSPSGKIMTLSHGNGSSSTYTYDARTEKLYQVLTKNGSNTTIQQRRYGYTPIGEINSINDIHNGKTYTYTYDSLSRLKTEVINGSTTSMSVNYDSLGNITSKSMNGNSFIYAYNDGNHAHAISNIVYNGNNYGFSHDANGNMEGSWNFTNPTTPWPRYTVYNADNMPKTVTMMGGGASTSFLYDGMGTRVKKSIVGGTTTYYIGDHFEKTGSTITKYIFAGNLRVAQLKGSARSYFHKDHLGSSTVMTDNSGAEIEATNYMPFGSQRDHSGTDTSAYRFTDQELDAENGLYNYGARLYDPFIGRFISPDTIVPNPYNPQSLNRYSYCLNNPLIYVDPSGHEGLTPELLSALGEISNFLNGGGFRNGFELGASISGLEHWNLGFEDLAAWMFVKHYGGGGGGGGTSATVEDLTNKTKEYASLEVLHWENKKQGGCGARAGWIKDDLEKAGYDVSYIEVRNTSFTTNNKFQYHVAAKVSLNGNDYVIDPYFWKGRREPLTEEYWLKKVKYSGQPGERLRNGRYDNPFYDPNPGGGTTNFPKTWIDPPGPPLYGYGYKNYSYKSTKDFYEIYLRGGHLQ